MSALEEEAMADAARHTDMVRAGMTGRARWVGNAGPPAAVEDERRGDWLGNITVSVGHCSSYRDDTVCRYRLGKRRESECESDKGIWR